MRMKAQVTEPRGKESRMMESQVKEPRNPAALKIEFAPMEGVTGCLFRNAHYKYYGGVDRYYTPFLSPTQNHRLSSREKNDVLPEHNQGICVIPQILTNRAGDFLWAAGELKAMGYGEVNLNLGCPSATVAAKGKGAGFLGRRQELEAFLDEIFREAKLDISVKTRIGKDDPEEFAKLIRIFNRYPIRELIIHPRVQQDFYKNRPRWEVFRDAVGLSRNRLCYNGDLFRAEDYERFHKEFPEINTVMLGRGAVANPALPGILKDRAEKEQAKPEELSKPVEPQRENESADDRSSGMKKERQGSASEKETFRLFHDEIYAGYREMLSGDRNVLFKMKELWTYWFCLFPEHERYAKKIRKAQKAADYETAVALLFSEAEFGAGGGFA